MSPNEHRRVARRLRTLVEPLAAGIYFAPEAHQAYRALGFGPSPATVRGVEMPDGPAYFTSRGACLGLVPGEVVAAAFGVFNPAVVIPAIDEGWSRTRPEHILEARLGGAIGSLTRILGPSPDGADRATHLLRRAADGAGGEGRHLFSGLRSLGYPGDPIGDLWRAADLVREHRGDSHIMAWATAGYDPVEIGLVTELYWGLPSKSYVRTRGWSTAALDAGLERLRGRGLVQGDALTDAGHAHREEVEAVTDAQERSLVAALGSDADELLSLLAPWAAAIVEAGGYPSGAGGIVVGRSADDTAK